MNFLVTGGAGFIGSNIVEELLKRGHSVRVLDNFSTGKRANLLSFLKDIELIEGDIRYYHIVNKALKKIDVILHEAALPSVPRSIADPISSNETNINGTLNVLEAARQNGTKRIVIASSSSVYGDTPELPKHEAMQLNPLSPYAVTKLTKEKYCSVFSSIYGLETIALRYFNVFGPRQDPNSQYSAVIPKFITAMLSNRSPVIYGDGEQSRDFSYISNVVEANILAATQKIEGGNAINIACHGRITLNELVQTLNEILGTDIIPKYSNPRPGDIKHSFADVSKAREIINYSPLVNFKDGLIKTVDWYRKQI